MRLKLLCLFGVLFSFLAHGQEDDKVLGEEFVDEYFGESTKTRLGIDFPIYRVYQYRDKGGLHYIVLTEQSYNLDENGNELNDSIKAFHFTGTAPNFKQDWMLKDWVKPNPKEGEEENSIWFWTNYISLKDFDRDGFVEPVIVYGTNSLNGFDDGRIKLMTYYKGKKVAIRHQNSVSDYGRTTQIDHDLYYLPTSIRKPIQQIMLRIEENNHGIFPSDWQESMKKKETQLSN